MRTWVVFHCTNTWGAGKTLEKYAKSQALLVCSVPQMDMPSDRVNAGADLGRGCRGCAPSPPPRDDLRFSNATGILQKKKKKTLWFIGVEVEQETSAPLLKKNPESAPGTVSCELFTLGWNNLITMSCFNPVIVVFLLSFSPRLARLFCGQGSMVTCVFSV